jgi:hypothetical protein
MPVSDCNDVDISRVGCQSLEIVGVRRDHGSTRFRGGDNKRIDGRATSGESAQECRATGESFRDSRGNVTSLQELVLGGVAARMALKTLDEHDGRNLRRPQSRIAQGQDQGQGLLRAFSKASHATGIEDQHGLACLAGSPT